MHTVGKITAFNGYSRRTATHRLKGIAVNRYNVGIARSYGYRASEIARNAYTNCTVIFSDNPFFLQCLFIDYAYAFLGNRPFNIGIRTLYALIFPK